MRPSMILYIYIFTEFNFAVQRFQRFRGIYFRSLQKQLGISQNLI